MRLGVGLAPRGPLDAAQPLAGVNRRIELLILTSTQSRLVANMFGKPGVTTPLGKEASIEMPDAAALERLRGQLPK